ncbi:hypothetical protein SMD22_00245 (plasmid) [Brevibacillus halotolerans]|nr:hypothetical protein SMD22_00245 [Brevibacillus halotolerans]
MRKVWKATLPAFCLSVLILTGCSPSDTEKQAQKVALTEQATEQQNPEKEQLTDLQKIKLYVDEQNKKMEEMHEELNFYKQYVKDVTLVLPSDKIQELIDKEYKYTVTLNSIQFPQSGLLEIRETAFDIVFSEERAKYSVLPETESIKGKLPTNLKSAISTNISPQVKQDGVTTILTYSYKDLKPGDDINFRINDELKKKLSVNTNELSIKVVK